MTQFDELPTRSCFNAATVRIERIFDELAKHQQFSIADEFIERLTALIEDVSLVIDDARPE